MSQLYVILLLLLTLCFITLQKNSVKNVHLHKNVYKFTNSCRKTHKFSFNSVDFFLLFVDEIK